jgi:integrin beta 3
MVAPTNSKYEVSKLISALTPAIAAPPVVSVRGRSAGAPKSLHGNATSLNVRAEVPPGIIVVVVGAVVVVVESTVVVTGGTVVVTGGTVVVAGGTVVVTGGTVVVAGGTVVVVVGATVVVVGA